jgi:predicted dehydrogenase
VDESGATYSVNVYDAVYATFQLEGSVIAQMNSSWCTRVYRDELLIIQVDGDQGSAVAGLQECKIQSRAETPRAQWNPDTPDPNNYLKGWREVPSATSYENAFKSQWEMFLRHVLEDAPFPHDFLQAARGAQVVEASMRSWKERKWQDVSPLTLEP